MAKNEMKKFLKTYLYVGGYTATSVYSDSSTLESSSCGAELKWLIQVDKNGGITGTSNSEGNQSIIGIAITDSIIKGVANDGTVWDVLINEDGVLKGTYNWGNGQCTGTISGTKS